MIHRLAGCWREWGEKHGYFDSAEDAQAFYDELVYMLLHQMAAPIPHNGLTRACIMPMGLQENHKAIIMLIRRRKKLKKADRCILASSAPCLFYPVRSG